MKVGVLTFHNTSNYGAALQAHSTIIALEKLGVDAEVIDYANEARRSSYNVGFRLKRSLLSGNFPKFFKELVAFPGILLRNASFRKFYKEHLRSSGTRILSHDQLKKYSEKYDIIIAGSDQIWSYKNNAGDFAYLLDFAPPSTRTVSYASSFGMAVIPESIKHDYSSLLNNIKHISVREQEGQRLISDLTGRDAKVVVDPVLLHDSSYWRGFVSECCPIGENFDFFYVNDTKYFGSLFAFQNDIGRLPVVSMGSFPMSKLLDRKFFVKNGKGPNRFLDYLYWARCVFTSSYHAVLFCLIFKKPFYVFLSGDNGRDSRILHVLSMYGLMDRLVPPKGRDISPSLKVDFSLFDEVHSQQKELSYRFLSNAIDLDADGLIY